MRALTEVVLAAASVVALVHIWEDRVHITRVLPLLSVAALGALGLAVGGRTETRLWGVAGAAYCLGIAATVVNGRTFRVDADPSEEDVGIGRLVLLAMIFVWFVCVDFAVGLDPGKHYLAYGVVAASIVASIFVIERGGFSPGSVARVGLVVVAVSDLIGIVRGPWRPCDQFKCSSLGALFRGPFTSENSLALLATMSLVWALTGLRGRARVSGIVLCLLTVFATGSRTGLIVSAISVVGWAAFRRGIDPMRAKRDLPWALTLVISFGVTAVGWELLHRATPTSFSNRGQVWAEALTMVRGHELFGVGLSSYSVLQERGLASPHFTHSEYLLFLFAGGYLAMLLLAVWGAVAMKGLARASGVVAAVPVVAFMVYGMTEATWNPLALDAFAWIALALSLTAGSADPEVSRLPDGAPVVGV